MPFIPHRLVIINRNVTTEAEDPTFMECMRLAFEWANNQGLQGKKVHSLYLEKPDPQNYNPMNQHSTLWCKIECTEEERAQWDEMQRLNLEHAIYKALDANS